MNVPFFDLNRLYLEQKAEIDAAVLSALASGHYILGARGAEFETGLVRTLGGSGHAVACNSGTDALVLSLRAAGVGVGDEVVTVSHTAIPTITAICAVGAKPVFVEVDPETWLIDPAKALAAIGPRTRAIIAVHLYGNVAAVTALTEGLGRIGRYDVSIIEDVAQAQGASCDGKQAGTIGRFGAFSFYPSKNIGAFGDGGAVLAASSTDAQRLRELRNYGQKDRYNAELAGGINSRLDEVQAAILSVRLLKMREWNARKDKFMTRYRTELKGLPFDFQKVGAGVTPAWHLCVIALESGPVRDRLAAQLAERGVQTLIHYPHPTHTQTAFKAHARVELPVTESLAKRILSLPMNAALTDDEQSFVISAVRRFFG